MNEDGLVFSALMREVLLDLLEDRHGVQDKIIVRCYPSGRGQQPPKHSLRSYWELRGTTIDVNRSYLLSQSFAEFLV